MSKQLAGILAITKYSSATLIWECRPQDSPLDSVLRMGLASPLSTGIYDVVTFKISHFWLKMRTYNREKVLTADKKSGNGNFYHEL